MKKCLLSLSVMVLVLGFAACQKGQKHNNPTTDAGTPAQPLSHKEEQSIVNKSTPEVGSVKPAVVPEKVVKEIQKLKLDRYPELTVLLAVKDVTDTKKKIEDAGGRIDYDPNRGRGTSIKFLIATLPPEKIIDDTFMSSLNLNAVQVDHPALSKIKPLADIAPGSDVEDIFVPVADVNLPEFRNRQPGKGLGEGVVVAVIDTGIDASHPVFGDRVIYWQDLTQEGRTPVTKASVINGKVSVAKGTEIDLPAPIAKNTEVYVGVIDETAMGVQLTDADKDAGRIGLDINRDGLLNGKFAVVVGKNDAGELVAFIDTDGNKKFENAALNPLMDFNLWRAKQRAGAATSASGMVRFPSVARTIEYPVIFETDSNGDLAYVTLGMDFEDHGTHVSGIIAGDGKQIKGGAPKAELMALKVCSALTCLDSAILRGILKAFYNEQNLVPDVVNISLGSQEGYSEGIFDLLLRDLSAKFGTVFFIAASNDGPGYRTINDLGARSPAILVGAHVSKTTMEKLYSLDPQTAAKMQKNNLQFFSSVGPSYTGELRPNIIAPGCALSSIPMIAGRADMYNGTSMASPMAAGSTAALLSLAKTQPDVQKLEQIRSTKISSILSLNTSGSSAQDAVSLVSIPLALRTSLENSATREEMTGYTSAQIGHGLIDINAAYDAFVNTAQKLVNGQIPNFFALKINNFSATQRLYERKTSPDRAKTVALAIVEDSEESETSMMDYSNSITRIELKEIQVQHPDGSVKYLDLSKDVPLFSIANPEGTDNRMSIDLVLANSVKTSFISVRHLELMEAGNVYIARYDISKLLENGASGTQRVFTILDVVHMPLFLNDRIQTVYLPGIDANPSKKNQVYQVAGAVIGPNSFHRYPIAVEQGDFSLTVSLGFDPDASGKLYTSIYDPDGNQLVYKIIQKSSQLTAQAPNTTYTVPTTDIKGVYEVVVANYSGTWMAESKYDLLIGSERFGPSSPKVLLAAGNHKVISFTNTSKQVGSILSATVNAPIKTASLSPFEVVPHYRTFRELKIPCASQNIFGTTVRVALDPSSNANSFWTGRIDNKLYTLDESGENPTAVYSADAAISSDFNKVFEGVSSPDDGSLYVAVETITTTPNNKAASGGTSGLTIYAYFPDLAADEKIDVKNLSDGSGAFIFDIIAPAALTSAESIMGTFKLVTDNPAFNSEIPVIVTK